MRSSWFVIVALAAVAGCDSAPEETTADTTPMPTTVQCADASALVGRAVDARRHSAELKGDRARIISGNRARFLASLGTVAQLKCRTDVSAADSVLGKAFEVVRLAEEASSEYEAALRWTEADLIAADAIALLIAGIPVRLP